MNTPNAIEDLNRRVMVLENALYTVLDCINFDYDKDFKNYKLVIDAPGIDYLAKMKAMIKGSTLRCLNKGGEQ